MSADKDCDNLITVGRCEACQKMGRLRLYQCAACAKLFGVNGGEVARAIRRDPALKARAYGKLESASGRQYFEEMFGPVEGSDGQGKAVVPARPRLKLAE